MWPLPQIGNYRMCHHFGHVFSKCAFASSMKIDLTWKHISRCKNEFRLDRGGHLNAHFEKIMSWLWRTCNKCVLLISFLYLRISNASGLGVFWFGCLVHSGLDSILFTKRNKKVPTKPRKNNLRHQGYHTDPILWTTWAFLAMRPSMAAKRLRSTPTPNITPTSSSVQTFFIIVRIKGKNIQQFRPGNPPQPASQQTNGTQTSPRRSNGRRK